MELKNKKILLGVSGSIAAYKSAHLIRLLVKAGADVRVIMTRDAQEFITPLTLSTLSKNPVYVEFKNSDNASWNNHVELGLWADLMLIAPATARTLARCANGICDNFLSAVYLSARCPVWFAPAMDLDMYAHASTQQNIDKLTQYGNRILSPDSGELASGLAGQGRMQEPEQILTELVSFFKEKKKFKNQKVLITAGPTREAIDPVRYISNHSSGKMGYALAEYFASEGAEVFLVSGPVSLQIQHPNITKISVESAAEMLNACKQYFPNSSITICCAAVADYTPENVARQKIKKDDNPKTIQLKATSDILMYCGQAKKEDQFVVGFALETENGLAHARKKLINKKADLIVLNTTEEGNVFAADTNRVHLISADESSIPDSGLRTKKEIAAFIAEWILNHQ